MRWESSSVNDGQGEKAYDVWLPENYDSTRSYPVVMLLHGCGSPTNNVPLEGQTGSDSIVIRGAGSGGDGCWDDVQDLPYLDAMLDDVQANFCVNPDHLFAVGYSSGSWVASKLSCVRGDIFRGIATVTGGEPGGIQGCSGQVGRMYVHDNTDNDNLLEWDTPSRDRMIQTNNCDSTTDPVEPSPCVEYQGCDPGYPVVWCETSGQGHSRQDDLAAPAFWNFFQSLMSP
jgi:poly(3-hydroxybutyrate) depolymerase